MGKPVYLLELTAQAWPRYVASGTPNAQGSWFGGLGRVAASSAVQYRATFKARSRGANGVLYAGVTFFDSSGNRLASPNDFLWCAASAATPGASWTTYTGTFGNGTANPVPAAAASMALMFAANYGSTAGVHDVREARIELTSAPGVAITNDPTFRTPAEWASQAGSASSFQTLVGTEAEALTLRYATLPYTTAYTDTPARTQYDARVLQPGWLRMALPPVGGGSIEVSYGQIVLNNADGELASMAYLGLDGQPFVLRMGQDDAPLTSFIEVMRGTMQLPVVDRKTVTIRLLGRDAVLDQPLVRTRYLGNNTLPNGLEGTSELAGQPKPRLYGNAVGLAPPCVNTSRLIYQVSAGAAPSVAVTNVWDAGVALTAGAAYTSQTDMETNAPAAGQYRVWPAGGYFRLGSAPAGLVTCNADATETSYGTGNWWWKLLYRMAIDGGVPTAEVQFAITAGFTQPNNWTGPGWPGDQGALGVWINDATTTAREAMNKVAQSVGAWYGYIPWGGAPGTPTTFGADIFPPNISTASSSSPTFDASNILAVTGVADPGAARGVPAYSVELSYAQNYTVFTPSMAPTLAPTALGALGIKNRRVVQADTAVQTKHVTARPVVKDTVFANYAPSVQYEATRQLELLRFPKLWFEARVALAAVLDMNPRPRLGAYVRLGWPTLAVTWQDGVTRNWGYFTAQVIELDFQRSEMRMTLRQATEQSI